MAITNHPRKYNSMRNTSYLAVAVIIMCVACDDKSSLDSKHESIQALSIWTVTKESYGDSYPFETDSFELHCSPHKVIIVISDQRYASTIFDVTDDLPYFAFAIPDNSAISSGGVVNDSEITTLDLSKLDRAKTECMFSTIPRDEWPALMPDGRVGSGSFGITGKNPFE